MKVDHNKDANLLHAIYKILLKEWDPLGIRYNPSMADEYEEYLPKIFSMICSHSSESEIFEYLWRIENKVMEQKGNRQHTSRIASMLKELQNQN
ncbi:hypothetical protein [Acinetobacter bouvetii]|uniref:DUF1871 family protein n=1 Tax=Acinetobacter bouvetii TaxID=202951 RepID=A0A811GD60_9GAMM|nr:hypothetical protein [Acinetobacter bouvetii]CAB1212354.1 hypothetical protein SFB21_1024 [Acinetobacter bouvetii]